MLYWRIIIFLVYFPTRVPSLRRSILDHSNTSINSGVIISGGQTQGTRDAVFVSGGGVGNFQECNYSNPPNAEIGLSRIQRRPFLRGSTMSMVTKPESANMGFVTNNLRQNYQNTNLQNTNNNNNCSDAISVKSVQMGASLGRMGSLRSSPYNNVQIICRDDDKDPLLTSLMSSPSKRSLSTKSLISTSAVRSGGKRFGTVDPETLPKTTMFMHREESGLTKEEIAG